MSYVNCLWHGRALGDLEQICLLSMLRQGHKVRLFCYDQITNVPAGVEVSDAREIMPRQELLLHRATGSPALGSNKFRYLIMKKGLGIWLDADVILVKPLPPAENYIFGWQDRISINSAVLYLPPDSPIVDDLFEFANQEYPIPPFYDDATRSELEQRSRSGHPVHVRDLPWGVMGPDGLTYFVRKHGLLQYARPRDVFYPVHFSGADVLLSSRYDIRELITPSTIAVHLWNNALQHPAAGNTKRRAENIIVERGSFVEKFAREQLGYRLTSSVNYGPVSRNAQCPCGSGKRYKHCHGFVSVLTRAEQPHEAKLGDSARPLNRV